jgi:hypothetical protein
MREDLRRRVRVEDDDIRTAGLGDPTLCVESPRLVAWLGANGFEARPCEGIYRDGLLVRACSPMAHAEIVNSLADAVGRAPLDVLEEIVGAGSCDPAPRVSEE